MCSHGYWWYFIGYMPTLRKLTEYICIHVCHTFIGTVFGLAFIFTAFFKITTFNRVGPWDFAQLLETAKWIAD